MIVRSARIPPAGVEERRVDRAARCDVDLVDGEALEVFTRAGSGDVEDHERREVDHADPVAHREVLGVDDRRPPARIPLSLARHDPIAVLVEERTVRVVPVRALPAGRLEEDRAQRNLSLICRRQADRPVRRPLLARVDDAVGLVVALRRPSGDVLVRLVVVVEAGDIRAVRIDLRFAVRHPLSDRLRDPGRFLDPDGGHRPEPLDLRRFADDRVAVRGQGQQPVDRQLHPDGFVADDLGKELEGVFELRVEVLLGERQHRRGEGGRRD